MYYGLYEFVSKKALKMDNSLNYHSQVFIPTNRGAK